MVGGLAGSLAAAVAVLVARRALARRRRAAGASLGRRRVSAGTAEVEVADRQAADGGDLRASRGRAAREAASISTRRLWSPDGSALVFAGDGQPLRKRGRRATRRRSSWSARTGSGLRAIRARPEGGGPGRLARTAASSPSARSDRRDARPGRGESWLRRLHGSGSGSLDLGAGVQPAADAVARRARYAADRPSRRTARPCWQRSSRILASDGIRSRSRSSLDGSGSLRVARRRSITRSTRRTGSRIAFAARRRADRTATTRVGDDSELYVVGADGGGAASASPRKPGSSESRPSWDPSRRAHRLRPVPRRVRPKARSSASRQHPDADQRRRHLLDQGLFGARALTSTAPPGSPAPAARPGRSAAEPCGRIAPCRSGAPMLAALLPRCLWPAAGFARRPAATAPAATAAPRRLGTRKPNRRRRCWRPWTPNGQRGSDAGDVRPVRSTGGPVAGLRSGLAGDPVGAGRSPLVAASASDLRGGGRRRGGPSSASPTATRRCFSARRAHRSAFKHRFDPGDRPSYSAPISDHRPGRPEAASRGG